LSRPPLRLLCFGVLRVDADAVATRRPSSVSTCRASPPAILVPRQAGQWPSVAACHPRRAHPTTAYRPINATRRPSSDVVPRAPSLACPYPAARPLLLHLDRPPFFPPTLALHCRRHPKLCLPPAAVDSSSPVALSLIPCRGSFPSSSSTRSPSSPGPFPRRAELSAELRRRRRPMSSRLILVASPRRPSSGYASLPPGTRHACLPYPAPAPPHRRRLASRRRHRRRARRARARRATRDMAASTPRRSTPWPRPRRGQGRLWLLTHGAHLSASGLVGVAGSGCV
jgi:hypothetical protein